MKLKLRSHHRGVGGLASILLCITAGVLLACPPALAQPVDMHGKISAQYRLRTMDDESDEDVYAYGLLDLGDPYKDKVSFHIFGRGAWDVDGDFDQDEAYVFDSIEDTYDDPASGRLYYAYLDVHRVKNISLIRLGRQLVYETPVTLYFDGARVETAEVKELANLKAGAYGGPPVHLYESYENNTEEDMVYGAFVQARPWKGGRVRFDWTHATDDYVYEDDEQDDDLYGVSVWQALHEYFRVRGRYTFYADEARDATGWATFYQPEWDLLVQGSYYELLDTEEVHALEFDPLYGSLFEYHPYWQARLMASKGFGENFMIEGGADMRRLKDEDDMSNFNHEFTRYWGTVYLLDLVEGFELSGTGEVWDSEDQLEYIESWGADLTYRRGRDIKASIGSYYSLYEYDIYLDEEKTEVQTYYAKARYRPETGFNFGASYEYEVDDFDDYQTVQVELGYSF